MKQKGEAGEYLTTNPPYGYMKDPSNPKRHWIVDDEAASIVRQIFVWCMEGYGPSQIAKKLKVAKVDCPTVHWMKMGRNSPANTPDDPYAWGPRTITGILKKQEYLGHMVNFKTRKLSYKSKKKLENPPDQWKIFGNTHEAIIDEDTFARVQELRKNKRRPTRTGKTNMFSGPLVVLIVVRNCTTVPATSLKPNKTILYVPLPVKRERGLVIHTSSELLYWKKVRSNT